MLNNEGGEEEEESVCLVYRLLFTVERLGKATAKYDDWPCYLKKRS